MWFQKRFIQPKLQIMFVKEDFLLNGHLVTGLGRLKKEILKQREAENNYILIRSNEMQQYAGVYLLQNYSACFGCLSHTSSGVHQTVTAVSGTGHCVRTTTFRQRGHADGRMLLGHYGLYQKLQLQFHVLLMMGAIDTRNM